MINIDEIIDAYKLDCGNCYAEGTLNRYIFDIKQFCNYFEGDIQCLSNRDIKLWQKHLKGIYASGTCSNKLKAVKDFFLYCVEEDILKINPAKDIKLPIPNYSLPAIPNDEEVILLQEATKGNNVDHLIITIFACTGIRPSEMVNIELEHVDHNNLLINIWEGKGLKERWVPITYHCRKLIEEYLLIRHSVSDYLLVKESGERYLAYNLNSIVKRYVDIACVNPLITPKSFRYYLAGLLFRKGFTIQEIAKILGHKRIEDTKRYIALTGKDINL